MLSVRGNADAVEREEITDGIRTVTQHLQRLTSRFREDRRSKGSVHSSELADGMFACYRQWIFLHYYYSMLPRQTNTESNQAFRLWG